MAQVTIRDKKTTDVILEVQEQDGFPNASNAARSLIHAGLRWRKEHGLGPSGVSRKHVKRQAHVEPSRRGEAAMPVSQAR